jgi:hypothetical protein
MLTRIFPILALLGLLVAPTVARPAGDSASTTPTLVIQLQSVNSLLENARYLAKVLDAEKSVEDLDAMLKNVAGAKGLDGLDVKRPLGLYGRLGPNGTDSTGVALLPITTEKAFLDLLQRLNVTTKRGDDGVYTAETAAVGMPIYLRFADKYAYVTVQEKSALDKDKLLAPDKVLPPDRLAGTTVVAKNVERLPGEKLATGEGNTLVSAAVHIDQVPDTLRQLVIAQFETQLATAKEQKTEGETEAQKALREQTTEVTGAQIISLIKDGAELRFSVDVDRKANELVLELSLTGQPKSTLAANIADLGESRSLFGGLVGNDAPLSMLLHASLPQALRAPLGPVIDEGFRQALAKEQDAVKRQQSEKLLNALAPTFKAGEIDAVFSMRKANKGDLYTVVAAAKLKDGAAIEKVVRDIIKDLPETERAKIKLDAATAGNVKIHRMEEPKDADAETKRLFGENPVFVAFRNDALFVSLGPDGLNAIKEAVGVQPKAGPAVYFEMAMGPLIPTMSQYAKTGPKAVREAFGDDKGADRIRLTVEGGKALRARLSVKTPVIKLFQLLQKAEAE